MTSTQGGQAADVAPNNFDILKEDPSGDGGVGGWCLPKDSETLEEFLNQADEFVTLLPIGWGARKAGTDPEDPIDLTHGPDHPGPEDRFRQGDADEIAGGYKGHVEIMANQHCTISPRLQPQDPVCLGDQQTGLWSLTGMPPLPTPQLSKEPTAYLRNTTNQVCFSTTYPTQASRLINNQPMAAPQHMPQQPIIQQPAPLRRCCGGPPAGGGQCAAPEMQSVPGVQPDTLLPAHMSTATAATNVVGRGHWVNNAHHNTQAAQWTLGQASGEPTPPGKFEFVAGFDPKSVGISWAGHTGAQRLEVMQQLPSIRQSIDNCSQCVEILRGELSAGRRVTRHHPQLRYKYRIIKEMAEELLQQGGQIVARVEQHQQHNHEAGITAQGYSQSYEIQPNQQQQQHQQHHYLCPPLHPSPSVQWQPHNEWQPCLLNHTGHALPPSAALPQPREGLAGTLSQPAELWSQPPAWPSAAQEAPQCGMISGTLRKRTVGQRSQQLQQGDGLPDAKMHKAEDSIARGQQTQAPLPFFQPEQFCLD